ncbi:MULTISPECIES: hypothetical protein [unclassified Caballeronia]|uniref:hypothetical protein n=1 Tax=unclassified Caballeronia TaxID=2646786 RepID=UPI0020299D27|nr:MULTISPECIES: hypothetical protein [unclassified Caballeronia]
MNTKRLKAIALIAGAMLASATAHARDDGPRFAQDRLDALVAHHAEASRHIAHGRGQATLPERRHEPKDAS